MMKLEELTMKVEKVVLEKIRFYLSNVMSEAALDDITSDLYVDWIQANVVHTFRMLLLGRQVCETVEDIIKVPATPWDHFKLNRFPKFLLKRFPPKMLGHVVITKRYHVCPHINHKFPKGNHIEFLTTKLNYGDINES